MLLLTPQNVSLWPFTTLQPRTEAEFSKRAQFCIRRPAYRPLKSAMANNRCMCDRQITSGMSQIIEVKIDIVQKSDWGHHRREAALYIGGSQLACKIH